MRAFEGLYLGYTQVAPESQQMSKIEMYMLNSVGDLEELNGLFPQSKLMEESMPNEQDIIQNRNKIQTSKLPPLDTQLTDCSAFIKILESTPPSQSNGDMNVEEVDIIAGHSTWRSYYAMLRIYKIYHLNYWKGSSYPDQATYKSISMSSSS